MFLLEGVPIIDQYQESLPTGCEATALTQALQYLGVRVNAHQIVHMLKREPMMFSMLFDESTPSTIKYYGGNPNRAFVGNPLSATEGMGVYEKPLIELVNNLFIPMLCESNHKTSNGRKIVGVKELSSQSLDSVLEYLEKEKVPIVIWTTLKQRKSFFVEEETWIDYLDRDCLIKWKSPEHCVTLVGFSDEHVIVNDPDTGKQEHYNKEVFEKRFIEMGSMAFSFILE